MPRETIEDLPACVSSWEPYWEARLNHALRRMQEGGQVPRVTLDALRRLNEELELPSPSEQGDNLILCVGDQLRSAPGSWSVWEDDNRLALVERIGAKEIEDANYVTKELVRTGLIEMSPTMSVIRTRPTFEGWERYEHLKREVVESKTAFMAMPFNDDKLDRMYADCFRTAVGETGFTLRRIDERPPAGSIINRMRVEIQRSRFRVAELTGDNPGVYWEAGFAEGLGRPVIYTAEKGHETHFDTSQLQTVFWSEDTLTETCQELKDTIRATLPGEAILEDAEE